MLLSEFWISSQFRKPLPTALGMLPYHVPNGHEKSSAMILRATGFLLLYMLSTTKNVSVAAEEYSSVIFLATLLPSQEDLGILSSTDSPLYRNDHWWPELVSSVSDLTVLALEQKIEISCTKLSRPSQNHSLPSPTTITCLSHVPHLLWTWQCWLLGTNMQPLLHCLPAHIADMFRDLSLEKASHFTILKGSGDKTHEH